MSCFVPRLFVEATFMLACSASIALASHELEGRDLIAGASIYANNCATCHGDSLEGQANWQTPDENGVFPAPPHDVSGHTWHHDNILLFEYTKLGGQQTLAKRGMENFNSGMPGFAETLTDDEIWDVLAFISSTWPPDIQQVQATRNPPHE